MNSKYFFRLAVLIIVFVGLGFLLKIGGTGFQTVDNKPAPPNSILHLELEGVIWNGKRFLALLEQYAKDQNIKAILISVNSPGGAVGPSQEMNEALYRVREMYQKPIVCHTSGVMASGAYYTAVACDQIIVAEGALIGSIGVIIEFANLERLYDWAKISRYAITSGKYKDSGSTSRAMRDDEKALFQNMIDEVHQQFRTAVAKGRKNLSPQLLLEYTDGRVFTGAKAVEIGFADQVGTFHFAKNETAKLANLGENFELFKPSLPRRPWWERGEKEDPVNVLNQLARETLMLESLQRPMYLMPGIWK